MSLFKTKSMVPHIPVTWAAAEIAVCKKHDECWVIPGGEHTSSRNRATYCAREVADLVGAEVPFHSRAKHHVGAPAPGEIISDASFIKG